MKYTKTNYQNIFIGEDYEIYKFLKSILKGTKITNNYQYDFEYV